MKNPLEMKKAPNVLLINADHWPATFFAGAGREHLMTPTLDTLAGNGIRFSNIFSSCPVCIPARRSLMTGQYPRTHGDRVYTDYLPLPPVTTLAQAFRDNGYQAYAVGKLHVYPQRARIGFDDVLLSEESRYYLGATDDYAIWLGENGFLGREHGHGLSNNEYDTRPWHLPEEAHHTNWATQQMIRTIRRRDPSRPSFYYLSYIHPHPPLVPLSAYEEMYRDMPEIGFSKGEWSSSLPAAIAQFAPPSGRYSPQEQQRAVRAFYALCTQIDHQLRLVLGTLREEGMLDNTIIAFTSDHGDMLFDHGLVAKRCFYQNAANIPFLLSGVPLREHAGTVNTTLGSLEDIMPTLLRLCGITIPPTVEGTSLFATERPALLYGEISEGKAATRMITDGEFKLIYYPYGNVVQLFHYKRDPKELHDLAGVGTYHDIQETLQRALLENLYGSDIEWIQNGTLVGFPLEEAKAATNYHFGNQRGGHWPLPPLKR